MKIDNKIQSIIESVRTGEMNKYIQQIDNSDFGLYIPVFEDHGTIKAMMEGYSQTERNLTVSVEKKDSRLKDKSHKKRLDPLPVGWFGESTNEVGDCIQHCNSHCMQHSELTEKKDSSSSIEAAPELDYHEVVKQIDNKKELLKSLYSYGMGLTLLHGHSNQFMFTKLPEGCVAVISKGVTTFRKESDVAQDETFVPNVWRSINGELSVAGGHSQIVVS